MSLLTVEVALPLGGRQTLTYGISPALAQRASPGSRVVVPFGSKRAIGLIISKGPDRIHPDEPTPRDGTGEAPRTTPGAGQGAGAPARNLEQVIDVPDEGPVLTLEMLELTRWAADYYLCSWGAMIRAAVPGGLALRARPRARATEEGRREAASLLPGALGPRAGILRALDSAAGRGLARSTLLARGGRGAGAALVALARAGLVVIEEGEPGAVPIDPRTRTSDSADENDEDEVSAPPEPSDEQAAALATVDRAFEEETPAPILLHGVTGSGKTEVYLRAIAACLARGRGAIYLVPEIGLTPLLARQIRARFGSLLATLHSGLPPGERKREWRRLMKGEARVALGARSAVFAPVRDCGLIVVDEEQDTSYKQEDVPRYNARDVALVRARQAGAVSILGTATPSLEAWKNVEAKRYGIVRLARRIGGRPMPRIELVDLREEFRQTGESRVLSRRLVEALGERLDRGEQSVVLINRRGYAPFLLCRACGEPVGCRRCSVSMVWHRSEDALRCHTCGERRRPPALCPECRSAHLQPVGEGSQRAETHLKRELPGARVVRMDSDTVQGKCAHDEILSAFARKEHDVLVGTQMVAKGHDFPAVTLVGVLLADATLGLPDFRAAERTYHLLTQVAGRAGRGELPGEVIVQAMRPDHYAIEAAVGQDEAMFFEKEMRIRRILRYPPFTVLAQVLARASRRDRAEETAWRAAESIRRHGEGKVDVLGPAPAPIERIRGRYRVQVLARATSRRRLGAAVGAMLREAEWEGVARTLTVDVDPVTLL